MLVGLALLTSCGDSGKHAGAANLHATQGLDTGLTIRKALAERDEISTDILVEASIANIALVRERIGRLRQELADRKADNSVCIGGGIAGWTGRPTIGKTAFTCNDYDYDLMILARSEGQSISSNLRFIEEFAEDPLHAGLVDAIDIVSAQPIDDADTDCARLAFRDPASSKVRKDVPIIVMIRLAESKGQSTLSDHDLRACLE